MYSFLVENMADEESYIKNLNIEVNFKEVCCFMCGEKFGRILFEIFCGYKKPKTGEIFVCNKDWLDLDEIMALKILYTNTDLRKRNFLLLIIVHEWSCRNGM